MNGRKTNDGSHASSTSQFSQQNGGSCFEFCVNFSVYSGKIGQRVSASGLSMMYSHADGRRIAEGRIHGLHG